MKLSNIIRGILNVLFFGLFIISVLITLNGLSGVYKYTVNYVPAVRTEGVILNKVKRGKLAVAYPYSISATQAFMDETKYQRRLSRYMRKYNIDFSDMEASREQFFSDMTDQDIQIMKAPLYVRFRNTSLYRPGQTVRLTYNQNNPWRVRTHPIVNPKIERRKSNVVLGLGIFILLVSLGLRHLVRRKFPRTGEA